MQEFLDNHWIAVVGGLMTLSALCAVAVIAAGAWLASEDDTTEDIECR